MWYSNTDFMYNMSAQDSTAPNSLPVESFELTLCKISRNWELQWVSFISDHIKTCITISSQRYRSSLGKNLAFTLRPYFSINFPLLPQVCRRGGADSEGNGVVVISLSLGSQRFLLSQHSQWECAVNLNEMIMSILQKILNNCRTINSISIRSFSQFIDLI